MEPMTVAPAFVLVHGSFLGPWIWADVRRILEDRGFLVVTPDLPSTGDQSGDLADDVTAVRQALEAAGPAVVCGHSYGGLVVTEAAACPGAQVVRLAYLAAAVPDQGHSMQTLAESLAVTGDGGGEETEVLEDGRIRLRPGAARQVLFHDCGPGRAAAAVRQLRPINPACGTQAVTQAAWRKLPSTLIEAEDDRLPRLVCAGYGAIPDKVVRLPGGHCVQWSRPQLVAGALGAMA
jgi:pimeloyl-ACP methyl ester carboxylesterase